MKLSEFKEFLNKSGMSDDEVVKVVSADGVRLDVLSAKHGNNSDKGSLLLEVTGSAKAEEKTREPAAAPTPAKKAKKAKKIG